MSPAATGTGPAMGTVGTGQVLGGVAPGGTPVGDRDGDGGAGGDAGSPGTEGGGPVPPGRRGSRWLLEAAVIVVVALLVAVLLRTFVVQTFYIPSGSMEPTLQIGDRILVDKLSYHLHGVDRGDIVVFQRPPTEDCGGPPVNDLVKRVVGLPGEVISLSGGYVYINGKRLNESYLPASEQGSTSPGPVSQPYSLNHPYRIPANDYFVMGDNRDFSCDSRYWGPISRSLIVGKVVVRVWPLSSFKFF